MTKLNEKPLSEMLEEMEPEISCLYQIVDQYMVDVNSYDRMKVVAVMLAKACEANISAHESGCVDYKGCECWWQNAQQALTEARKILGDE